MAATDRVQIFFTKTGDRFWTNVFYVNALNIDAASSWANVVLATAMVSELNEAFRCVKTLVDHLADDTFASTPLNLPGETAGSYLPLFATACVDISVTGHGRNDKKFIRGWLHEGITTDGNIDDAVRTAFDDVLNGLIADSTASGVDLVDKDGHLWELATTRLAITGRQEHRRRKKIVP